jgi:3-ketosteroid 9alpha-monooxygenase subunit B
VSEPGARHRYHPLPVARVVTETADACSIVFDVPAELADVFGYDAGQFVSIRAELDGGPVVRSYSMSSAPAVDDELQVTVKRVPGGLMSNWLNDTVAAGDVLQVLPPAGAFVLDESSREVLAFAAGSGITPVFSIIRWALAKTDRRVRLLYANRDRASAIFADALDALAEEHPDRLAVQHHLDEHDGFVDGGAVTAFVGTWSDADVFVCGPAPFMDLVEYTLTWNGVPRDRLHLERFVPAAGDGDGAGAEPDDIEVTIRLGGRSATATHRRDTTLLQTARSMGLRAPSSCEAGNCATCMARLVQGSASMRRNDALTPDEVADGWVLTCQAVPTAPIVEVVYE